MKSAKAIFVRGLLLLIFTGAPAIYHAAAAVEAEPGDIPADTGFNKYSITFHGGTLFGFTDIKEKSFLPGSDELSFGGGISFDRHYSPAMSMQLRLTYAELAGMDPASSLSFETEMLEAVLRLRLSLNALLNPEGSSRSFMNLYAFIGAGALSYRSVAYVQDSPARFYGYEADGTTKDDMLWEFVVPYGLGLNFRLTDRVDLGIETGFRYTSSDRLDAWPVTGSRKDMYNYTSVGLSFKLGRNRVSADWAPPRVAMYPGDLDRFSRIEDDLARTDSLGEVLMSEKERLGRGLEAGAEQIAVVQRQQETTAGRVFSEVEEMRRKTDAMQAELERISARLEVHYAVQVSALREEMPVEKVQELLKIHKELRVHYEGGWYKYITGNFLQLEDAVLQMQRIWGQGVRDAFVVKYVDGVYLPR